MLFGFLFFFNGLGVFLINCVFYNFFKVLLGSCSQF